MSPSWTIVLVPLCGPLTRWMGLALEWQRCCCIRGRLMIPGSFHLGFGGCSLYRCCILELSHHAVRNASRCPTGDCGQQPHQIALCVHHLELLPRSSLKMTTAQPVFDYKCFWEMNNNCPAAWSHVTEDMRVCTLSRFSRVQLFVTSQTVAHQAPLSMGFSRQEYWSGLPWASPGDFPNPGINPAFHISHIYH